MQRYVAILQRDPNNTDALYYIAVPALQEGQTDEAHQGDRPGHRGGEAAGAAL